MLFQTFNYDVERDSFNEEIIDNINTTELLKKINDELKEDLRETLSKYKLIGKVN